MHACTEKLIITYIVDEEDPIIGILVGRVHP